MFAGQNPPVCWKYFYSISSATEPLSPAKTKEPVDFSKEGRQQQIWKDSGLYYLLHRELNESFYMRVHNETFPASGKEIRKKILYDDYLNC